MSADLFQLLYFSRAIDSVDESTVHDILEVSRANNQAAGITGVLLFEKFHFMQVLEGTESAVREVFDKIRKDQRHTGIVTIYERTVSKRQFTGWAMARCRLKSDDEGMEKSFLELIDDRPDRSVPYPDQSAAIDFVRCFEAILATR